MHAQGSIHYVVLTAKQTFLVCKRNPKVERSKYLIRRFLLEFNYFLLYHTLHHLKKNYFSALSLPKVMDNIAGAVCRRGTWDLTTDRLRTRHASSTSPFLTRTVRARKRVCRAKELLRTMLVPSLSSYHRVNPVEQTRPARKAKSTDSPVAHFSNHSYFILSKRTSSSLRNLHYFPF